MEILLIRIEIEAFFSWVHILIPAGRMHLIERTMRALDQFIVLFGQLITKIPMINVKLQ